MYGEICLCIADIDKFFTKFDWKPLLQKKEEVFDMSWTTQIFVFGFIALGLFFVSQNFYLGNEVGHRARFCGGGADLSYRSFLALDVHFKNKREG